MGGVYNCISFFFFLFLFFLLTWLVWVMYLYFIGLSTVTFGFCFFFLVHLNVLHKPSGKLAWLTSLYSCCFQFSAALLYLIFILFSLDKSSLTYHCNFMCGQLTVFRFLGFASVFERYSVGPWWKGDIRCG